MPLDPNDLWRYLQLWVENQGVLDPPAPRALALLVYDLWHRVEWLEGQLKERRAEARRAAESPPDGGINPPDSPSP